MKIELSHCSQCCNKRKKQLAVDVDEEYMELELLIVVGSRVMLTLNIWMM